MYLLCGLGNPGNRYQHTRHNIGFMVLDKLISKYNIKKYKSDKTKEVYKGSVSDTSLFLLKPLNYMNLSGTVIRKLINFYKIPKSKILIIHDDHKFEVRKKPFNSERYPTEGIGTNVDLMTEKMFQ